MKTKIKVLVASLLPCLSLFAQTPLPGAPEDNGLAPKTDTKYLNVPTTDDPSIIFNSKLESMGVAIAKNGSVIIGWEDDGSALTDQEAIWSLFDPSLNRLTPPTEVHSLQSADTLTTRFLSYFRKDASPIPPYTSWGPKIKANLFSDGIGMGGTSFAIDLEIPELDPFQNAGGNNSGDFPTVQLLTNDGNPVAVVPGVSQTFANLDGDIRVADWDYLSTGNIVIAGEDRQEQDLVDVFGGPAAAQHAVFRIVKPDWTVVKPETLASSTFDRNEMWHGVGVTKDGFGLRFSTGIRLFKNDGTPLGDDIDLSALTGEPGTAAGGRGDGVGFHGNGKDAYVVAAPNGTAVWVTVLNADGTVRWFKNVAEDGLIQGAGRADAAIDASGRVIVVYDAQILPDAVTPTRIVMGRMLDAKGAPVGGTFYVSENERPDITTQEATSPRIAWRSGLAAVVWESRNSPDDPGQRHAAARLFSTFTAGSAESAGLTRIVPDTPVINPGIDSLDNWEPYTSVLGNSTFLIEANTFADGTTDQQRFVLRLQPVTGGPGTTVEGFYGDDAKPYNGPINLSRQNGNPGRVAGDKRPGAVNYILGGETSLHGFAPFQSDNRWSVNGIYTEDHRYAAVETYKLDPVTLAVTPLSKASDPIHSDLTAAFSGNVPEVSRFGGELAALDNGNFVVVTDDRSNMIAPARSPTAAIITPSGQIVKHGFAINDAISDQIWSNVAAYKGGFAVRFQGVIYFFDNDGNLKGQVDQNTSGETGFDRGRGDGTRIASHINTPYVFLAGVAAGRVRLAVFDSRTASAAGLEYVDEPGFAGVWDRIGLAVDALNRVVVGGVVKPAGYEQQQVAARVMSYDSTLKSFTPLTPSFFAFINVAPVGIRSVQMNPSITTKQILIAAKGEINLQNKPENGPDSPRQIDFYTVLSHPVPQDDPTPPVGGTTNQPHLTITRSGQNVTISWDMDLFVLQKAATVKGPWDPVVTVGRSYTTQATGTAFYRLQRP